MDTQNLGISTQYSGPTQISEIVVGGLTVRLARPAQPDRLLEDAEVLRHNAQDDYMPYWAYLWPGAFLLAEAIATENWSSEATAIEIGCGLGLAGLSALAAGLGRVEFTDYDDAPFRFIEQSLALNEIQAHRAACSTLDWRAIPDQQYPVVLGADVLYERRLVPLVVSVIQKMLAPDGFAMVAGPYRVATEDLAPRLQECGLRFEARSVTATGERGEPLRGTLHRIWRSTN